MTFPQHSMKSTSHLGITTMSIFLLGSVMVSVVVRETSKVYALIDSESVESELSSLFWQGLKRKGG